MYGGTATRGVAFHESDSLLSIIAQQESLFLDTVRLLNGAQRYGSESYDYKGISDKHIFYRS